MKRSSSQSRAAFSLVEIAIALGVVAFGLLSVITVLPSGLETLRVSATDTVEARITQEIDARLQASDWDQTNNLADFHGQVFYFDNQGNVKLAASIETIFTAQVSVASDGPLLPAADDPSVNPYLREVAIKITSLPDGVGDRFSNPQKYRQIAMLATKMSR